MDQNIRSAPARIAKRKTKPQVNIESSSSSENLPYGVPTNKPFKPRRRLRKQAEVRKNGSHLQYQEYSAGDEGSSCSSGNGEKLGLAEVIEQQQERPTSKIESIPLFDYNVLCARLRELQMEMQMSQTSSQTNFSEYPEEPEDKAYGYGDQTTEYGDPITGRVISGEMVAGISESVETIQSFSTISEEAQNISNEMINMAR